MYMNDLVTAICTLAFLIILAYISAQSIKLYSNVTEGLENASTTSNSTTSTKATGVAGGAASYADAIKSATTKITDAALVTKYRKDYENIVINAEEFVNATMLNVLITSPLGPDGNLTMQTLSALNMLNASKVPLNEVMKYVDSL